MRESENIIVAGPFGLKIFECSDNPDRQMPIKSINGHVARWRIATLRLARGRRKTHPGPLGVYPHALTYPPASDGEFSHYAPAGSVHYFRMPLVWRTTLNST